ncbi:MAG: hypothetical protein ACKOAD_02745 [Gammaproteobacteria bacterium]
MMPPEKPSVHKPNDADSENSSVPANPAGEGFSLSGVAQELGRWFLWYPVKKALKMYKDLQSHRKTTRNFLVLLVMAGGCIAGIVLPFVNPAYASFFADLSAKILGLLSIEGKGALVVGKIVGSAYALTTGGMLFSKQALRFVNKCRFGYSNTAYVFPRSIEEQNIMIDGYREQFDKTDGFTRRSVLREVQGIWRKLIRAIRLQESKNRQTSTATKHELKSIMQDIGNGYFKSWELYIKKETEHTKYLEELKQHAQKASSTSAKLPVETRARRDEGDEKDQKKDGTKEHAIGDLRTVELREISTTIPSISIPAGALTSAVDTPGRPDLRRSASILSAFLGVKKKNASPRNPANHAPNDDSQNTNALIAKMNALLSKKVTLSANTTGFGLGSGSV